MFAETLDQIGFSSSKMNGIYENLTREGEKKSGECIYSYTHLMHMCGDTT